MRRKRIHISSVFAGQRLGGKELDEGIWSVSFTSGNLGFADLKQKTCEHLCH